jgi:dTDP-3-amino-3,4,6-trideoxy-alpha-D-glucose transaminase
VNAPSVPLVKMDKSDPELFEALMDAVRNVAARAAFTLGDEVDGFEQDFATYCGAQHAVGVSSGTEALVLALRALGVGSGDEVVLPTNSFIATAEAVSLVGATPCLVDVDPETHTITAAAVERALSARTRCVIPVHLYGRTVDMDPIVQVARAAGVFVIEDACQAHGAYYRGRRVGTIGDCGCFSFYPAKNLGAWGDGGALVTNDAGIADQVRLLRSHGERPRYHHRIPGTTARLDALQAAILRVKLPRLDEWNDQRRAAAAALSAALEDSAVELPVPPPDGFDHVYHQYVVTTDDRDNLRERLGARGIPTGVHYPIPIHRSEAYSGLGLGQGSLPAAERLAARICSLPIFPGMTDEEIELVAASVRDQTGAGAGAEDQRTAA